MMREEAATYQIEGAIAERQGKRIADNAMISRGVISDGKMSARTVQQHHIERDATPRQSFPHYLRDFPQPSRHF
jgi:hypothetical protein